MDGIYPRVESLQTEPTIGETYLVRCVMAQTFGEVKPEWLPIIGKKHNDKKYGFGTYEHYHFDVRFLNEKQYDRLTKLIEDERKNPRYIHPALNPLQWVCSEKEVMDGTEIKRPFVCLRAMPEYPADNSSVSTQTNFVEAHREKCFKPSRPFCPHQKVYLGNLPCTIDQKVVCPGHGLAWNLATGKMIERKKT